MIFLKKKQLFILNTIILTITSFFLRGIGMSFNVYVTNKIGATSMGVYQLIISLYAFFITLSNFGISFATTRIVAENISKGNKKCATLAVRLCLLFSLITSIISVVFIFIFGKILSNIILHDEIYRYPIYILAITLPFVSIAATINGYFTAKRKAYKNAISQIIEQFFQIIIVYFILAIFMPKEPIYSAIALGIASLASEICSFLYIFISYVIEIKKEKKDNLLCECTSKKEIIKNINHIAVPVAITSCIRSFLVTIKNSLIPIGLKKSGMSYDDALAKYGIINAIALPLLLFPSVFVNSFSNLLMPEFSRYMAKNDYNKMRIVINKIFKITLLFSCFIIFLFLIFADDICSIIYKSKETSIYVKILAPMLIVTYLDTIVDSMLRGIDEQVSVMKVNILDLFISIFLIYFMLPKIGIIGYILVIYISEFLNSTLSIKKLMKKVKVKFKLFDWIIKPCFAGLLTTNILSLLSNQVTFSIYTKLILYTSLFFCFIFLLSCLKKEDLKI